MGFGNFTLGFSQRSTVVPYGCGVVLTCIVLSAFVSCKKLIEIKPAANQISTVTVFSSDESATSAMVGLYSQIMSGWLFNGNMTLYPGLSSDELNCTNQTSADEAFVENALLPDNSTVATFWSNAYSYVYQCNAIMEGLAHSPALTDSLKTEISGEAHFMRAFCYFYLVNIFGDVPLETTTNYAINASMSRTAASTVLDSIVADLIAAQSFMKENYVTSGRLRPNKWTAAALLARVYLYQKNWTGAEQESSLVIGSNLYGLNTDLDAVFVKDSKEAIWQLLPVQPGFNAREGYLFVPMFAGVRPSYALSSQLLASFEKGDNRRSEWVDSVVVAGQTYYYPYKYKVAYSPSVTEYYTVFRLAEQYLIRAEARAELNDLEGAESDLNMIRHRAGLPDVTATDATSLLSAIMHERRVELFCEWGNRWLDLKRSGQIDSVLGQEKNGWKSTDALYPVPFAEIRSNPKLSQNAGY